MDLLLSPLFQYLPDFLPSLLSLIFFCFLFHMLTDSQLFLFWYWRTCRDAIREERACQVRLLNYKKDGTPFFNLFHMAPVHDQLPNGKTVVRYYVVRILRVSVFRCISLPAWNLFLPLILSFDWLFGFFLSLLSWCELKNFIRYGICHRESLDVCFFLLTIQRMSLCFAVS